jgi:hypothetical protein
MATVNQYAVPDINLGTWDLNSDACGGRDTAYMEQVAAQALEIAGAKVNVFKMLGVHEQGLMIDLTGSGNPISSMSAPGSLPSFAFTNGVGSWVSAATGPGVMSSFLGYSFGTKKTIANTERYAPSQPVRHEVTTIKIQQSADPLRRVLQARVERSDDGGGTWKRVDVVNLPNTGNLETIAVKQSAPTQIWRLVPLMFSGGPTDPWEVVQLQLMDYTQTSLDNVQDMIFLENRDRDYAKTSIQLRAKYDLLDVSTELTKFGIDLPTQFIFTVSFARMIELLGRPVVIGDILELPNEAQYDANLKVVRKWLEVTDCSWSLEGYAPGWKPLLYKITAVPAIASQETMDVFKQEKGYDQFSDDDFLNTVLPTQNLGNETSEAIDVKSKEDVPEVGSDTSDVRSGMNEFNEIGSYDGRDYSVEDALPPNNLPYTEGMAFPASVADGAYHRLVYAPNLQLPAKLYQWSVMKNRWIYLETDRRRAQSSHKPSVDRILNSTTRKNISEK